MPCFPQRAKQGAPGAPVFPQRAKTARDVLEEVEADHFAANMLIPTAEIEELRERCDRGTLTHSAVLAFAADQGVAPGIVVTRLQRLGWQVPEKLNRLKRIMEWAAPGTYANV